MAQDRQQAQPELPNKQAVATPTAASACRRGTVALPGGAPASTHLGEQVVHHVCADVVLDLVEDAVVAVNGGQAAAEVRPLGAAVPVAVQAGAVGRKVSGR